MATLRSVVLRGAGLSGLLLLLLLALYAVFQSYRPSLAEKQRRVREKVEQALAKGQPDVAQKILHDFVREIDDAEAEGLASPEEIAAARRFVDETMQRIVRFRENRKLTEIVIQVKIYLEAKKFLQARRYVVAIIDQLHPSERMEARLHQLLLRIEDAEIDDIERQVETYLDHGKCKLAQSLVELALLNGEFSETGLQRLGKLSKKITASCSVPPVHHSVPHVGGLKFIEIPAGHYRVGSPATEPGRDPRREVEPEEVHLTAFFISTTEVTQEAFTQVSGKGNWKKPFAGKKIPAHSISYGEAEHFCKQLTAQDGWWVFSLPSEVEWEVAARGGRCPSTGPVAVDSSKDQERFLGPLEKARLTLQKYAFFLANKAGSGPMRVGKKKPNALGLYDMHGNVAEWCRPMPDLNHWPQCALVKRPTRGGSVLSDYQRCRAAARACEQADTRKPTIGFRIVARRP